MVSGESGREEKKRREKRGEKRRERRGREREYSMPMRVHPT